MKRKLTFLSRFSGIMLGVSLTFLMAVFAVTSVITNGDFWLKQNDRYKHQETLSLVSSDDYSVLYTNYISMFSGTAEDFTVTKKGNPDDFSDTFKKLGSVHPSEKEVYFEKSFSLTEKFLKTVESIEKAKYSKADFDNKTYIEFSCPLASTGFSGVNIKDLKITDNNDKDFEVLLKTVSVLKDGSIKTEMVEGAEILFKPQSKTTVLRAYLSGGNIENINFSFKIASIEGSAAVNILYSYEDSLTNEGVASIIGPEENIVTNEEKLQILNAGKINATLKAISIIILTISVMLCIFTLKTEKRESLLGIGFYTVIVSLVLVAIIDILVYYVPSSWGFDLVFDFSENSTSSILMGQGFMEDFASGTSRFFTFVMIAPVFLGYVLTKLSKPKHYDPNEDYLYQ